MKFKWLTGVIMLGMTAAAWSKEPPKIEGWGFIDSNESHYVYGKNASGELINGVRSIIIQLVPKPTNSNQTIYISRFKITDQECKQGIGVARFYTLSGEPNGTADYVKGGANIGSLMSEIVCNIKF